MGEKGDGFGLSTASPYLAEFCIKIFKEMGLRYNSCPWQYNGQIYHQIYVPRSEMLKLLKAIPLKNKDKIDFISLNMPPWLSGRARPWYAKNLRFFTNLPARLTKQKGRGHEFNPRRRLRLVQLSSWQARILSYQ